MDRFENLGKIFEVTFVFSSTLELFGLEMLHFLIILNYFVECSAIQDNVTEKSFMYFFRFFPHLPEKKTTNLADIHFRSNLSESI